MPSILDELLKGKRSLTEKEYDVQFEKVNKYIMDHQQGLKELKATIEKNEGNIFKNDKNIRLQEIEIAKRLLNQIKPHNYTEEERRDLRKSFFSDNDVEKEGQAYFKAMKALDKKLVTFDNIYVVLEKNITTKLKSVKQEEKPKPLTAAFDKGKERKEDGKKAILDRLKAQGAVSTAINPGSTRPRQKH